MSTWDVFVSYTHADMEAASRIQAFIEDYPLPGGRNAVRVFRDKTDLAAGDLGRSIPREIDSARVLMLCCSPAAARSGWVSREVDAFDAAHGGQAPIVPLLLDGTPETSVPPVLRGRDALILDLRAGWRFGRPRTTTRVELLRALAAAADMPLRELIRWTLRGAAAAPHGWAVVLRSRSPPYPSRPRAPG
jgi:TIR domain